VPDATRIATHVSPSAQRSDTFTIGMIVPMQGPAGIFGPSCEAVAATAVAQLNERGLRGQQVDIELIDGGATSERVAADVRRLLDAGRIDAVTGWHISAVRHSVAPVTLGRIPYVYTSLYEGGEQRPGVVCTGETPLQQVAPALRWLRDQLGVRRWYIVGDDYVWPRLSSKATVEFARALDLRLSGSTYVPLGSPSGFATVVRDIAGTDAQGVLMYLVGQDAVRFNRAMASAGLDERLVRYSPLMEENMLIASGANATRNLFVSAAYFRSLATRGALDLNAAYVRANGPDAPPLNNAAESCYEGVMTLAALVKSADSTDVRTIVAHADGVGFDGPRGPTSWEGGLMRQHVYLATADGFDFDVLTRL